MKRSLALVSALSVSAVALWGTGGCGSEESTFNGGNGHDSGTHDPGNDASFNEGILNPNGNFDACVSDAKDAALQPADLIMMFDKSGSMGDTNNQPPFDPALKWNPVTAGMKAFLSDPGSSTLNASLQFFPWGDTIDAVCAYDYTTPKVALSPLTQASVFTAAIDATKPQGGTPTLPAVRGAIAYAKQIAADAKYKDDKIVIVLITDGDPGIQVQSSGCPNSASVCFAPGCKDQHECPANPTNPLDPSCNNTVATISGELAAAKGAGILTYVIGIGSNFEKSNLTSFAQAGGTNDAFFVDVGNPSSTTGVFQNALDSIRSVSLSCSFSIPTPDPGKTLDYNKINVVYQPTGGAKAVLGYSKDCSNPNGWHYDDPTSPKKVQLCDGSCGTAQKDRTGKITLAIGCVTVGDLR